MNDVDLLIPPERFDDASAVLRDCGWQAQAPVPPPAIRRFLHAWTFGHPQWLPLDLHWRAFSIACRPHVDRAFWGRLVRREVEGVPVLVPDVTDLLLLTCYHRRKADPHAALRWVIDASRLLESREAGVDGAALVARAAEAGAHRVVADALETLEANYDVQIPSGVADQLRRVTAPALSDAAILPFPSRATAVELMRCHWTRFSSARRAAGLSAGPLDFVRYLVAFVQWQERLDHASAVPGRLVRAAARRVAATFAVRT
jgi:hypothetical protein